MELLTSGLPAQRPAPRSGAVSSALSSVSAARLVDLLSESISVPTVTGTAEESEGQHLLARRFEAMGLDTDLWRIDLDDLDATFPGMEAPRDEAWGLVGSWGGSDGPTVVLNGHLDVVPTGDPTQWSNDPFRPVVRDGAVFGRGACDMKAGLVCQVAAVEALQAAGVRLRGRVQLQSVVGEEDGGLGTWATVRRGHTGDVAVVCEPTSLALVPACAGALTFRLTVQGLSAHGSVRYEGVDAVDKYLLVHQALRRLEAARNRDVHPLMAGYAIPYPLSVGTVRAGDWPSSVPDLLVAEGRLGVALGEPVEHARTALEDAVAQVCADDPWLAAHPVTVEWSGGQFAPGELPSSSPLLAQVSAAHRSLPGDVPAVHGAPYGSDQRLLTGAGIPTRH